MKKVKRFISVFLAVVLLYNALPVNSLIPVYEAEAASGSEYEGLNDNNTLKDVLIGQTGSGCVISSVAMMLRRACIINGISSNIWKVVNEGYIKSANGGESMAWSIDIPVKKDKKTYATFDVRHYGKTYNTLSKIKKLLDAHPEGVLFYIYNPNNGAQHGVLLTHYDGDVVYCLDPATGGKICKLADSYFRKTKYTGISSPTQAQIISKQWGIWYISSGINYCTHKELDGNGDCVKCKKHFHSAAYDENGICKKDGFDYYSQKNIYSDETGSAIGVSFNVYNKPYKASGRVMIDAGILQIPLCINGGKIVQTIKNHLGETWYKLGIEKSNNEFTYAYIQSTELLEVRWDSHITFSSDVTSPKNNTVAGKTAATTVKGTITASHSKLKEVTAAVYDLSTLSDEQELGLIGNKYTASEAYEIAKGKAKYYGHDSGLSGTKFDLNQYDDELKFRLLSGGNYYLYVITASDNNGVNACSVHYFYLKTSSTASAAKYSLYLVTDGIKETVKVTQGSNYVLPGKSKIGCSFLGWTTDLNTEIVEYHAGENYRPPRDGITLYAVFQEITPPSAPTLTAVTYDIALGDVKTISWNGTSDANKYTAYVYDETGERIYEQSTSNTFITIPFSTVGIYTVKVEAFNGCIYGSSGESEQFVTVNVHGPSTVTFLNYDGSVYATQDVPYGGSAETPTSPSRTGYTFSRWVGSLTNVTADRSLTAEYTPIPYQVTFYDHDGVTILGGSAQTVYYNGDEPGSAVEPTPLPVENYTFVGWNTGDWERVTYSGVKVYPVYVWANENLPIEIQITSAEREENSGYWVYYTITNHGSKGQLGRVVIAGKNSFNKFITQTESGAFYLRADGTYSGNVYVPVSGSDMQTLAKFEAYVVDSYKSTKPIAMPAVYTDDTILTGSGEYSAWMTADELNEFPYEYTATEAATQYRYRTWATRAVAEPPSGEDWVLDSQDYIEGTWGEWSEWSDEAVTASDTRQVETQQVQLTAAVTKYRYGRYKSTNCSEGTWYHFNDKSAKNLYGGTWSLNYTSWSTTRHSVTSANYGYATTNNTIGTGTYNSSNKRYYWNKYTISGSNYWWEEKQTTAATYKTQYRYRDKAPDVTYYNYYHWSAWSFNEPTTVPVQDIGTQTVYRVKLVQHNESGTCYPISASAGSAAAGKQALLTVYKVDEASDYSNQYIEQITLDENGAFTAEFYTLQEPNQETGNYTVALTIEGATESLYIETIEPDEIYKQKYDVTFVDEVTDEVISVYTAYEGGNAEAPVVPVHEGYYFLGWEYGLGNIREDMIIHARYVEKKYVAVFVDSVNGMVNILDDISYGSSIEGLVPVPPQKDGYIFLGWKTIEGDSISTTITGHMVAIAQFERISYPVDFIDIEGNVIATKYVDHGDYVEDPFLNEGELVYDDEEDSFGKGLTKAADNGSDSAAITWEDLKIPDSMYFVCWTDGAESPVTEALTLAPVLSYCEDTDEITASLDGGVYINAQTVTLSLAAEDISTVNVKYRLITDGYIDEEEDNWIDYDLAIAPEIQITETCVMNILAVEDDKNSFVASYEYIIISDQDLLPAPAAVTATQNDSESVVVNWSAVSGADGYMVTRISDCEETSEFDVGNETTFIDYAVDPLRTYTYMVCAYVITEKSGASMMLEGNATDEERVVFYGENTPAVSVTITAPEIVYAGSAVQLTAAVSPDDAYETSVVWNCTDGTGEGYITYDGLFYGVTPGTVTVTAKTMDGSDLTDSVTITVQEIPVGANSAVVTVSSSQARAGGTANVSVSISENSYAEAVQFALLYDSSKLTLTNYEAGNAMQGLAPTISNPEEGVIIFVWESLTPLTAAGSMLDLTFAVKADATGTAFIEIPTDSNEYDFSFARGNDMTAIEVASINGTLNILSILYGDVDENGKINVIDANLVRRYAARLVTLNDTQLMAADVNGDEKVNVIDANLIRRYAAHLINIFPADAQ